MFKEYKRRFQLLLRYWAFQVLKRVKPEPTDIDLAIKEAFAHCGLPLDSYSPEFDLLHSGKFHEVLHHAALKIGNPLITVEDLYRLLK